VAAIAETPAPAFGRKLPLTFRRGKFRISSF
jgi:hypothetical protein